MKAKKAKKNKIPKDGSWKRIEWELEQQGAFSKDVQDGDAFFIYGQFSSASLSAFNDRYRFNANPITTLVVFKENRRLKEELRFGFDDNVNSYHLWGKKRIKPGELIYSPLNWDDWNSYGRNYYGSRYVAATSYESYADRYFYMDRVI